MNNCKISVFLGYGMAIYVFASLYYLLFTRNIGTPFNNSLTQKQILIKKKSAKKRKNIFIQGCIVGLILSIIFKPFKKC